VKDLMTLLRSLLYLTAWELFDRFAWNLPEHYATTGYLTSIVSSSSAVKNANFCTMRTSEEWITLVTACRLISRFATLGRSMYNAPLFAALLLLLLLSSSSSYVVQPLRCAHVSMPSSTWKDLFIASELMQSQLRPEALICERIKRRNSSEKIEKDVGWKLSCIS
jgi:hypothetical protein